LNFSAVNPDSQHVENSFFEHLENCFFVFGERYRAWLDDTYYNMMATQRSSSGKLEFLAKYAGLKGLKVYVLIDEYDNFANTILTTSGQANYHELTHGAGFFRFFFNVLKAGTTGDGAGISRLFITGVSPVTMDDVTSGFNIGRNISLDSQFNELLGFTEEEVLQLVRYYQAHGMVVPEPAKSMELMREWYDNYRFAEDAAENVFNTDMVLYFIQEILEQRKYPKDMIDQNVRVDYSKLRHLVVLDQKLNGNFLRLEHIIETGKVESDVIKSFPVERLTHPTNFVSLLFYFGLLSYAGTRQLRIPNQTVRTLMYGYLRDGYEDVDVFRVELLDFVNLLHNMVKKGEWEAVFRFLAEEVEKQTSIRDYLSGEKVIQTFLLAYLNVTDLYLTRTEDEMGKGFVDIYLEPFLPKYPDIKYGYLIELKYIERGEYTKQLEQEKLKEAHEQLRKYSSDERILRYQQHITIKCISLVFCGWELKVAEELEL
jgi:hypothetical protein